MDNLRMAEGFEVEETPTLKIFHNSKLFGELIGYLSLDEVVDRIKEILQRIGFINP